jgi:hypothetical protein
MGLKLIPANLRAKFMIEEREHAILGNVPRIL